MSLPAAPPSADGPTATAAVDQVARWWAPIVLVVVTLVVFEPTLWSGFVYDARMQILTDTFLHEPANWWNVLTFRVLAMDVLDFNRPVHLASLMADAALWGRQPFGYHLTSILLHAANAVLVWLVVRDVLSHDGGAGQGGDRRAATRSRAIVALVAAGVFAVHPVVVEAVCEPTFREDLLAAAFTLGAVVVAARHVETPGGDPARAAACAALCLLAVASKESGVAAPLVVAAWWRTFRGGDRGRFWPLAVGGGLAAVAAFLAARFALETSPSRIFEVRPLYPGGSLATAMAIEPRILALYAQLIVLPVNLSADYGLSSVRHLPLWAAATVLAGLAAAAVVGVRGDRRLLFGIALVVVPLLPVSNLVPIYRAAADRYLYLPMAGVACIVGSLLDRFIARGTDQVRQMSLVGAMAVVAALAVANVSRQAVWANSLALWEDTYRKIPASFTAAYGYSSALRESGSPEEAATLARRAIDLAGGTRGDAWLALALALDAAGKSAEAVEAAAKAIEVDGRLADPDARVAALAMERDEAEAAKRVIGRIR